MRLLVFGGRFYHDDETFDLWMRRMHGEGEHIKVSIEGGAPGADTMARNWAAKHNVKCLTFHADWKRYGKAAGPLRNQQMIEHGQPDHALAFPGGDGTLDMLRRCIRNRTIFTFDVSTALFYKPLDKPDYDFREYMRTRDDPSRPTDNA
jgi:hypothetical protein